MFMVEGFISGGFWMRAKIGKGQGGESWVYF